MSKGRKRGGKRWAPPAIGTSGHPRWIENKIRKTSVIQCLELRAAFLVEGIKMEGKALKAVAQVGFPNHEIPEAAFNICMRQPLFRMAAAIKVQEQVRALGLTKEDIITRLEESYDVAMAAGRADWMVKAVVELEKHVKHDKVDTDNMDYALKGVLLDYNEKEEAYMLGESREAEKEKLKSFKEVDINAGSRRKQDVSGANAVLKECIEESGVVWEGDNALDDPKEES